MLPVRSRSVADPKASRSPDGRPIYRIAFPLVRPRVDPGQAVLGDRELGDRALQHARQGRRAPQAAVRVREGPARRRARRDGQGLRVREGPLRDLPAGGAEGAAGEPEPHDRHRRLHPRQGDRSDLLRQGVLPRSRQARRQALQPPDPGDARKRPRSRSPSGRGRPSSTSSRCGPPRTASSCSSCSTRTKCAR